MPLVTNIFLVKQDEDPKVICLNVTDTEADITEPSTDLNISYDALTPGEKATVDAFEALAISKLP